MTQFTDLPLVDKLAMGIGGGLIVFATVVLGIVELLAGNMAPLYRATVDGEAVTAITQSGLPEGATNIVAPVVPPNIRAYLIVAGLIVFGLYAVYVIAARRSVETSESRTTPQAAD